MIFVARSKYMPAFVRRRPPRPDPAICAGLKGNVKPSMTMVRPDSWSGMKSERTPARSNEWFLRRSK